MALKLTEAIDFTLSEKKAARRRVADIANMTIEDRRLDGLEARALADRKAMDPRWTLDPGTVASSIQQTAYVKNCKHEAGLMADKTQFLADKIYRSNKEGFSIIEGVERASAALESDVKESELEYKNDYSKVHFNAFVRHQDLDEDFQTMVVRADPKTGVPFLAGNVCELIHGTGITLPLREEEQIAFIDAKLVSEGTDRGDSYEPLISTLARNVLLPDQIFRYSIVKKEHDETSRLYPKTEATCTLQLEVSGLQLINALTIEPAAGSSVFWTNFVCISDNGTEQVIAIEEQELTRRTTVLFAAIRARYIILTFKQYAPIERTRVVTGNTKAQKLNEFFEASGFSPSEVEHSETFYGAIYDFSLASIKGYFRAYNSPGVFCSSPVRSKSLIALSIDDSVVVPPVIEGQYLYSSSTESPLVERYAHIEMTGVNKELVMSSMIPLRDGATQTEGLPLFGKISKLKFFPDIYKNLLKARVTAVYNGGTIGWVISCPDGIPGLVSKTVGVSYTDNDLRFIGPDGCELVQGPATYKKMSTTSVRVTPYGTGNRTTVSMATIPYLYAFFVSAQTSPIVVTEDATTLALGTDYDLSFDGGGTWVTELPYGSVYSGGETAGSVQVRFTDPDYNSFHAVTYPVLKTQWLEPSRTIRLKNFRVGVVPEKKRNACVLHMVYIIRAFSTDAYVTPLVENYSLNLRELDVS